MAGSQTHDYRVFTTKFDREVAWEKLDNVLGRLSPQGAVAVDASLVEFGAALAASAAPAERTTISAPHDRAVTLLLDQSGSMRGRPMALAAAAISQAVQVLRVAGCRVEVLGFTTASWRGGRSRRRWKWMLRPRQPGRLCELLHIIYRDSDDDSTEMSNTAIRSMLRPDLPKENIDGEAVVWAATRLLARPEPHRTLVVLSDGSPVDDSTQQANGPLYLDAHLQSVLEGIRREGQIQIGAVGVGYDVSGWYPASLSIKAADDLGASLNGFLDQLLASPPVAHGLQGPLPGRE